MDLEKTSEETTAAATDSAGPEPANGAQLDALAQPNGEVKTAPSGDPPASTPTAPKTEAAAPDADEVAPKKKKKKKKKKAKGPEPEPIQPIPGFAVAAIAVAAVAVIALIAVTVVGVVQWRRADHASSQHNDRLNAAQTAGTFGEALLTYDSVNPTATLNRLKAMATAAYQPRIEQARKDALTGPSQQGAKTTSTAHAENVYVTEVAGQSADAICQTSWVVSSAGQSAPPVEFYLKVGLKKQGGAWKVDSVSGLAAQQPGGTTTPTTPTSPTTTPTTAPRPGG